MDRITSIGINHQHWDQKTCRILGKMSKMSMVGQCSGGGGGGKRMHRAVMQKELVILAKQIFRLGYLLLTKQKRGKLGKYA